MTATTSRPSARRDIPVRRLRTGIGSTDNSRVLSQDNPWLVQDDPVFSHFLAMLSALFPNGEDFFVTTVRNARPGLQHNEVLRQQINAFIGQEAMHGREHRALNAKLSDLGYPVDAIDAGLGRVAQRLLRLPGALPLAVTAASEHLTGTLAPVFLTHKPTQEVFLGTSEELSTLVQWHALEELEHKNVAFDVLAEVDGRYVVRAAGFWIMLASFGRYGLSSWIRAVVNDRSRMSTRTRRRFRRNLSRQAVLTPRRGLELLEYLRPRFHPDDTDTDHLVDEWRVLLAERTVVKGQAPVV